MGPNLTDNCELLLNYMKNGGSVNYCSIGKEHKGSSPAEKTLQATAPQTVLCFISECRQGSFAETLSTVSCDSCRIKN